MAGEHMAYSVSVENVQIKASHRYWNVLVFVWFFEVLFKKRIMSEYNPVVTLFGIFQYMLQPYSLLPFAWSVVAVQYLCVYANETAIVYGKREAVVSVSLEVQFNVFLFRFISQIVVARQLVNRDVFTDFLF